MKDLTLLFSSSECDIFYNQSLRLIQTRWKGIYVSGAPLRKILDEIIKALAEKKASAVIADAREMKIIAEVDRSWIVEDWYPRAIAAGFKCQALVITKDSFNEQALKLIVLHYDHQAVKTAYFISIEEAREWVKNNSVENCVSC